MFLKKSNSKFIKLVTVIYLSSYGNNGCKLTHPRSIIRISLDHPINHFSQEL